MTSIPEIPRERKLPSRKDAIVFRGKTLLLQIRRAGAGLISRETIRHSISRELNALPVIAVSKTSLWTETEPQERFLVAGKIHNLRIAAARLDGLEIPANSIFSFWKHVGRASRRRGFVVGRELREGCVIPNIGGGLCQISNALYDAALKANFEIIERHAHTQIVPGSLSEKGRDATVFWNYVDLRFRSETAFRIEAALDAESLTVTFRGSAPRRLPALPNLAVQIQKAPAPGSCVTCEVGDCHRNVPAAAHTDFGNTAYLLDEYSPEFDDLVSASRGGRDRLMIPIDGRRFGKANYRWNTKGFAAVRQSLGVTLKRSYRSRKLSAQGASRQQNLLHMYRALAESYARALTFDVLHIVVQQKLLPYLWMGGHLGGRTFDVLMNELPMQELQGVLDDARSIHPESPTLGDFRADPELIAAESDALRAARRIITPHTKIASLFPEKAVLLDWKQPSPAHRKERGSRKPIIVFPASTVGRKGCYELRQALEGLDVTLLCVGPLIEDKNFWADFDRIQADEWLEIADLVVLPAFVEHRPRRLIQAAAANIPVIASDACGVENIPGVHTIKAGDAKALRAAIIKLLPN